MLVQHASLGLGKIVAVDPDAVHVFFVGKDERFATKLRMPMAGSFLSPSPTRNTWLSKLSAFGFDAKAGRYRCPEVWSTHADAVARFQKLFPKAFQDPKYLGEGAKGRRERSVQWRRAQEAWAETVGRGEGQRLLAAGELGELVERVRRVEALVRGLQGDAAASWLDPVLAEPDVARLFLSALFDLLSTPAPKQARFEALLAACALLPASAPESAWPMLTVLPYLALPERHMLLEPRFAGELAQRLGFDVPGEAPSWRTYQALLDAAAVLLEQLRPLGARDHVDVEAFVHLASARPKKA
jgi:hypothetical protein